MKVLTIRNVPEGLYRTLTARAKANGRSLQQEALALLDRARAFERHDGLSRARSIRDSLTGRGLGDTIQEIRADRDR